MKSNEIQGIQGNTKNYDEIQGIRIPWNSKVALGVQGQTRGRGGQSPDGDVATAGRPLKNTKCGGAGLSRRLHKSYHIIYFITLYYIILYYAVLYYTISYYTILFDGY